jgi:hypothetical protein
MLKETANQLNVQSENAGGADRTVDPGLDGSELNKQEKGVAD